MTTNEKLTIIKTWTQRCEILPQMDQTKDDVTFGYVGWYSNMDINQYTSMMTTSVCPTKDDVIKAIWCAVRASIIILVAQVEKE